MGTIIKLTYQEVRLAVWVLIYGVGPISRQDVFKFMSNIPGKKQLQVLAEIVHRALADLEDEALIVSMGNRQQMFSVTPLGRAEIKKQLLLVSGLNQVLQAIRALAQRRAQNAPLKKESVVEDPVPRFR